MPFAPPQPDTERDTPMLPQPAAAVAERPVSAIEASALRLTLRPLQSILSDPDLTELCINRPGEAFIETRQGWCRETLPMIDYHWCHRLAKLAANATRQRVDEHSPLLSASLPQGERIQIVLPPATTAHTVAITIRRPGHTVWSLRELAECGLLRRARRTGERQDDCAAELRQRFEQGHYEDFLRLAVQSRRNILVSGPTGSGKTTFTKALIREIPSDERLITIEDASELRLDDHPNHVRLYYSKDDQGQARVTPKQLLECCLRMRPDRILLAELRAEEAFEYLRNISGHPGSITSVHAGSAALAFEQVALLVKQSPGGRELGRTEILHLLHGLIDVVVQFGVDHHQRYIQEIFYEPAQKRDLVAAVA